MVTFEHCTFSATDASTTDEARGFLTVSVQGAGTMLSVSNCAFTQSQKLRDGCTVQQGARLHIEQCVFQSIHRCAVHRTDAGSRFTCCRSEFSSRPITAETACILHGAKSKTSRSNLDASTSTASLAVQGSTANRQGLDEPAYLPLWSQR